MVAATLPDDLGADKKGAGLRTADVSRMRITDRHVEMASSGRRAKVALLKKRFRLRRSSKR